MTFRRRAITVEAIRFSHADVFARTQGRRLDLDTGVSYRWPQEADWPPEPTILTRDGIRHITDGDWIVTYPDGHTEPMRHAAFASTFERIDVGAPVAAPAERSRGVVARRHAARKKSRGRR